MIDEEFVSMPDLIERLQIEVDRLTAERDELAKVLREGIPLVDALAGMGPRSGIFQWAPDARAALAALPTPPEEES